MRMRLGLLRGTDTPDKKPNKDGDSDPTSASRQESVDQGATRHGEPHEDRSEQKEKKTSQKVKDSKDTRSKAVRIRPLSEAKAIDTGANFISETFLFLVGGSLILFESWRSRRKENIRREDVAERLEKLEALDYARDLAHEKEINALQAEIATLKVAASPKLGVGRPKNSRESLAPSQAPDEPLKKPSSSVSESKDDAHH